MKRVIAAIALAIATLFGISAIAPSPAIAGNGTSNFYLGPEDCWIGSNDVSLESTNWDSGANQVYHLWIWKQNPDWGVGFYLDTVGQFGDIKDGHNTHEYYITVEGHGQHRLGIKSIGSWCAYYQ
jgi:hypothetical protein